jgi:predicted PilT family ATPase
VEKEYVGRIVGAQGAGVNKLRDQLGVKVDVSDDVDERETGKKKKVVHQKSRVKVHPLCFARSDQYLPTLSEDYWPQGKCRRGQETNPFPD